MSSYLSATRKGTVDLWSQVRKQFLPAIVVGVIVGLGVTAIDVLAYEVLWGNSITIWSPVTILLLPTFGLLLSGLLLDKTTKNPKVHGTEEYIDAYHEHHGVYSYRSIPGKVAAALATVGFGGSAGMEAPSIFLGSAAGSFLVRHLRRFGYTDEDVKRFAVAGAAAGVSAIFKAPLTGVVFALEVPYMDDLAHESLVPALVSSISSYLVLVQFLGATPLFQVAERYTPNVPDLIWVVVLGVGIGLFARAFIASLHAAERFSSRVGVPLWVRTGFGGLAVGCLGLVGLLVMGNASVLGTGYPAISGLVGGASGPVQSFEFLLLKIGATVATIGSGAAGGLFIPMIAMGAAAGSTLKGVVPGAAGPLFPVIGMAAFLAAGYNTPIAAAVFVAESTGGAGYLIPGLVASVVAYTVAGRVSVSKRQRWRREDYIDRLMDVSVRDIMTKAVVSVPLETTVREFLDDYVLKYRRKGFPVVEDGRLVGFASLSDVREVPQAERTSVTIGALMAAPAVTTFADRSVGEVAQLMSELDLDRVPVVAPNDETKIVGILSSTDILAFDRVLGRELS